MAEMLTLGPVLFNWAPETWRDFYFQMADEAPVDEVFLGEVICSKRAPLFDDHLVEVVERLESAGKRIVFSTLAEVTSPVDRRLVERVAKADGPFIEVNDTSALWHLEGRPHAIGPYMNVYNEDSLAFFAGNGARSVCLPPELPAGAISALANAAEDLGVALEAQVYGRVPLALSARCYHARAEGRTKDSCQYVCDKDPDGMTLRTLEDEPFLAINGIQTLSYTCLNLIGELEDLARRGITRYRISPQSEDTLQVTQAFAAVLEGEMEAAEALADLRETGGSIPYSNGLYHGAEGHRWIEGPDVQPPATA